jgi:hypothetical protein
MEEFVTMRLLVACCVCQIVVVVCWFRVRMCVWSVVADSFFDDIYPSKVPYIGVNIYGWITTPEFRQWCWFRILNLGESIFNIVLTSSAVAVSVVGTTGTGTAST